eukprot:1160865-Pelagomonas_calceolata.AAC.5
MIAACGADTPAPASNLTALINSMIALFMCHLAQPLPTESIYTLCCLVRGCCSAITLFPSTFHHNCSLLSCSILETPALKELLVTLQAQLYAKEWVRIEKNLSMQVCLRSRASLLAVPLVHWHAGVLDTGVKGRVS